MVKKRIVAAGDETIATGTLLSDIKAGTLESSYILPAGHSVRIARIINTPAGLSFRIKNSLNWVKDTDIVVDFDTELVCDYTKNIENFENKIKKCKYKKINVINKKNNSKHELYKGVKNMDKRELRNALQTLNPGDRVKFTFCGSMAEHTGEYTFLRSRTGRGKGGSLIVEMKDADGHEFQSGTSHSDNILHVVTPDGVMHGYESESDIPPVFETNSNTASELKQSFARLLDAVGQYVVDVESSHAPFNGAFTVLSAKQLRGRYGQVVLTLLPLGSHKDGTQEFELWSFRHSGVVQSFSIRENS